MEIKILGTPRFVPGYVEEIRQPVVIVRLSVTGKVRPEALRQVCQILDTKCGVHERRAILPVAGSLLERMLVWTAALLEKNNHPVCQQGKIKLIDNNKSLWSIVQPCINPAATTRTLLGLVDILSGRAQNIEITLSEIDRHLQRTRLKGFNQFHFIKAAHELNIPWEILPGGLALLGLGSKSRLLDSSITDRTSSIGTRFARNKLLAANMLRYAGFPAPDHVLVKDEDKLMAAVEHIGFPLVVKPVDRDGGQGVKANLTTFDQALKAFRAIKEFGADVLVERHVFGRDYRLQVVEDEVQGVLERSPGGVVGNGLDTVRDLVVRQNDERASATDDRRFLHAICFDDEAEEQLRTQGLHWQSVPALGQFVRLRGACNVAGGGIPREIPLEEVHPDNLLLARNAAQALRLDVAGIDLLIPDIAKSWLETGAHICEVNAQPQMFTTMHGPMLSKLLHGGDGRIPVVAVITNGMATPAWVRRLAADLSGAGIVLGAVSPDGVSVGGTLLTRPPTKLFPAVKMLSVNTRVDAILMVVCGDQLQMSSGWPVDRCHYLVIDGKSFEKADQLKYALMSAKRMRPRLVITDIAMDNGPSGSDSHYHVYQSGEDEVHPLLFSALIADISVDRRA